jgi:hypothetical protein
MSLGDWLRNDWLKRHVTTKAEISGLLAIVDRELSDSQVDGVSADGRFNHAYRAALTLATVLLYAFGYTPARGQSHHYRTIEAIPKILRESSRVVAQVERCETLTQVPDAARHHDRHENDDEDQRELDVDQHSHRAARAGIEAGHLPLAQRLAPTQELHRRIDR